MLRWISTLSVLLFFALTSLATDIKLVDGLYLDENNEPFTGQTSVVADMKVVAEYHFLEGLLHGPVRKFYESGALKELGSFKYGQRDGNWRSYHEDGSIEAEACFVSGERHGAWRLFDANGTCRAEMYYDLGAPVGHWSAFDQFALVTDHHYYQD